jgi:predicted amidohydrolase
MRHHESRRDFLRLGTAGLIGSSAPLARATARPRDAAAVAAAAGAPGRPVRVVSLSFRNRPLPEVVEQVDREGARGVDLVALPETWRGQTGDTTEPLDGPTVTALAALARKHATYIVCPIDRKDGPHRRNTAVLIDRQGKVACTYDKVYPYWAEFDIRPPVDVGRDVPVHQADFGRVGMAICFDVNFPEVWQRLADRGAELVVWPSAYSAGTSLMAHAINHHFTIVTATLLGDCLVFDITGRVIHDQRSEGINVSRITLDLDRGIYHSNFNLEKRDRLLREHGDDVEQELWLDREQWFVLRARRPGVSARALARQYGMEELRDYLTRSRRAIDRRREGT